MINDNPEEKALLTKLRDFIFSTGGMTWGALLRDKDTGALNLFKAGNRPCYGEMRRYGPNSTRPEDYHPDDLTKPITPGIREAVGLRIYSTSDNTENHNRMVSFFFNTSSPWIRGITPETVEYIFHKKTGKIVGMTMTGTDVDPTVLVSLFMNLRVIMWAPGNIGESMCDRWCRYIDKYGMTEKEAFIFVQNIQEYPDGLRYGDYPGPSYALNFGSTYTLPINWDYKGFIDGKSRGLSNGRTWRDQEDYNRPSLQDIFRTGESGFVPINKSLADKISEKHRGNQYLFDMKHYDRTIQDYKEMLKERIAA